MADKSAGVYDVNKQLHDLLVPVADLHEDPDNARDHDSENSESIAASYARFKQNKPIVCNKDGKVIAGNGQLAAARDILEWTHIACIRFEDEDAAEQMAFAIADNRTAELATWNFPNLAEHLTSLGDNSPELLASTGFSDDSIQKIMKQWGSADSSGGNDDNNNNNGPELGDIEYKIVVDCRTEDEQAELLAKFEEEGLLCRALMS